MVVLHDGGLAACDFDQILRMCPLSLKRKGLMDQLAIEWHYELESHEVSLHLVWHKIVQVHPVTGRTVLYMNFNPIEFNSVSLSVGEEWLQEALAVATQEQYVYRHEWKPGDLLIWDNHAVLHSGTPTACYESDRRLMHRSFVYTQPTERTLENLDEVNAIFLKA